MSSTKQCKVVSLDTSIHKTGYAVYIDGKYGNSGILIHEKNLTGYDALIAEARIIIGFLNNEKPDIVVVETTQQKNNLSVYKKLSMLLGVVLGYCVENGITMWEFEPKEWRSRISKEFANLKREEAKTWSVTYVEEKYNTSVQSDDEADAVLIGQAQINLMVEEDNGL